MRLTVRKIDLHVRCLLMCETYKGERLDAGYREPSRTIDVTAAKLCYSLIQQRPIKLLAVNRETNIIAAFYSESEPDKHE
jgi:hypothetical protein